MKVHVDMNLCQSHGECEFVAPDIFHLGDDDVLVWKEEVDDSQRELVEEAIRACPMMAISAEADVRMTDAPVVVVGASLAGLRAAEAMRGAGYDGELVAIGDEPHLPYTRPPLSKELLAGAPGGRRRARSTARAPRSRGGSARPPPGWISTAAWSGSPTARRSPSRGCCSPRARGRGRGRTRARLQLEGVHVLRDIDQALALRRALAGRVERRDHRRGLHRLRGRGHRAQARPRRDADRAGAAADAVARPAAGRALRRAAPRPRRRPAARRRAWGRSRAPDGWRPCGSRDGTRVPADVVLVALGAVPNTDWLRDSGLRAAARRRLRPDPGGARRRGRLLRRRHHGLAASAGRRRDRPDRALDRRRRAGRGGRAQPRAARRTSAGPFVATPYFWSDQYDVKIQSVGFPARATRMRVDRALRRRRAGFVAVGERDGRLVAAVGFNAARRMPLLPARARRAAADRRRDRGRRARRALARPGRAAAVARPTSTTAA